MEGVLAEALLAQARDPRALLAALSGGEASAERVEALRVVLQRLEPAGAGAGALPAAARELAAGYLLPLLRDPGPGPPARRGRVLRAAGAALRSCARLAGARALAEDALRELAAGGGARAGLQALAAVAPCLRPREDAALLERVARAAVARARAAGRPGDGDDAEAEAARRLLPALARGGGAALGAVWDALAEPAEPGRLGPELQLLSALAEQLLPAPAPEAGPDARRSARFWEAVQAGLGHAPDALARKRARYLLRRALEVSAQPGGDCSCDPRQETGPSLFWWSEKKKDELLKFWENYILIMETLEGNQIHVIKPVLPKLNNLFDCAVSEENGSWLFHPSWLTCIYKRLFESENKVLTKEGVAHFLELYETRPVPPSPEFSEFVIGPLMDALSESSLYSRSPGQLVGSGPPLGLKLQKFLGTYVSLLPEETQSGFLLQFLQRMTSRHWCAVPILFLSKALANVPRCKALGVDGLLALRDVIRSTMITHQVLLRGAAQCFLLQTAMHLVDVEKVSLSDVSTFLMSLRQEESLARGTVLWKELCDWLRVNERYFKPSSISGSDGLQETSLNAYVKNLVQEYVKPPGWEAGESCGLPDWSAARLTATMVLMAVDVEALKTRDSEKQRAQNVLRIFLAPLLDVLMKCGTNAYMPVLRTDRGLQLLLKLLQGCGVRGAAPRDDEVLVLLQSFAMSAAESVTGFILRRLTMSELHRVSDLDHCRLYLMVLTELVHLHPEAERKGANPVCRVITPLINASLQHLQEADSGQEPTLGRQIQKVVSMAAVAWACEAVDLQPDLQLGAQDDTGPTDRFLSALPLNQTLQKPCAEQQGGSLEAPSSSQGWGRVVSQYVHDQWVCLSFLLKKYQALIPAWEGDSRKVLLPAVQLPVQTLRSALAALPLLPSDQVLPVFRCLRILVPKLLTSAESLCIESFDMAWKTISSLSNTQLTFWPNLKAFVQFVFDNEVLTTAAKVKGQAYFKIKEIMYKVIEMSAIKTGVFNTLISYCCRSWVESESSESQGSFSSAQDYSELVLEACVFGTVFRRDQRLTQDVQTFIENLGQDCAANVILESTKREDYYVRICAIKFLCLLDCSNVSHKLFMEDLVVKLLEKDELVSQAKTRYRENSEQHRVKNRVWQALLVLAPSLDQNFLNGIIDKIFQAGFTNNQASIKYLIEWIIILILHKFPQFLPKFWDCFSYGEEKLKTSICTFLSILTHLDIITQNIPEKRPALRQALQVALRWCLSHNFSTRLYALVALKKVWKVCTALRVEECDAWAAVVECSLGQAEGVHGAGNAGKNWLRIQEHFFFTTFRPLEDYCLETIFFVLPRLSGLAEEEWVAVGKFASFTDIPSDATSQWYLSGTPLSTLHPGAWTQRDAGPDSAEADSGSEWADVQRKIIPWRLEAPDPDLEVLFQDRAAKLGKSVSRLIVVASLIDKPTNLGGLCRTCEVFGASALVVGSLRCVGDRQFQHLSVSAEQWLPLVEVKPPQLMDYLQQKKAEGYTVIGAEQTARSADLAQFRFPEKSLLLLGNEREGIPAHLIQQLDVCVEIPQQGVTRSLNVHVSGALLVWEYTRQQLLGRPSPRREVWASLSHGATETGHHAVYTNETA